ncbi:MAG: hypothetical protein LBI54_01790 [Lachnospiraceae bacterium]|nr:hypothetical protein [Lachnospiraceae bacterium]
MRDASEFVWLQGLQQEKGVAIMAITIVEENERKLVTEQDVDREYLGKFVLVDRTSVPETHNGGYVIAFGDLVKGIDRELFDYSQTLVPHIRAYIMSGLAERGGDLWISRDF